MIIDTIGFLVGFGSFTYGVYRRKGEEKNALGETETDKVREEPEG